MSKVSGTNKPVAVKGKELGSLKKGAVNWEIVDEDLDAIPDHFKDPRFDSLRHVLDILSAVNAEAALEDLREQRDRIEQLVDDVVQGYHNGFNKAIHNYSQILRLFADSKSQVDTLRKSLEDAKKRLGAKSRNLQQQWRRSITLGDTMRMLGDIMSVVDVPKKVLELEEAKDWTGAVHLLLDACNKLARQEVSRVGALRDIKKEMSIRRSSLQKQLVQEIERRVYSTSAKTEGASELAEAGSEDRTQTEANIAGLEELFSGNGFTDSPRAALKKAGDDVRPKHKRTSTLQGESVHNTLSVEGGGRGRHRRTATFGGGGAQARKGLVPSSEALENGRGTTLVQLVELVCQIGGVNEAQQTIKRHLPTQVRTVILKALEAAAKDQLLESSGSSVAAKATRLTERVFDQCLQVLRNFVALLRMLAGARPPNASAGLELLMAARAAEDGGRREASVLINAAAVRKECEFVWETLQKECQKVLAELLVGARVGTAQGNRAQTGTAWLAIGRELGKKQSSRDPGALTFSFDIEIEGKAVSGSIAREKSLANLEVADQAALIREALGGAGGGAYLTPLLYRPVVQFVDAAGRALSSLDRDADSGASGWVVRERGSDKGMRALRAYVEAFVTEEFLPEVYVDFRGRCAALLEDPEAFKSRARLRASYSPDVAQGRPVLAAALAVERLMGELLGWAGQMPLFATHLTGVVENILGRVLDAFQTRMMLLAGGVLSRGLAESPTLAQLQATEPAAPLLGPPVAFCVAKSVESLEAMIAAVTAAGLGSGEEAAEAEVLARLLAERPVRAEALMSGPGDATRLANVAALADSLDYIADVIDRTGRLEEASSTSKSGGSSLLGGPSFSGRLLGGGGTGGGGGGTARSMTEGLAHLAQRYRAAGGACVRCLRLEMQLLVVACLQELPRSSYVCGEGDSKEVDECIGTLTRTAARAEEDLSPYLAPNRRAYVFGSMASTAARMIMWLLPELQDINQAGAARMSRMLAVLQTALGALGGQSGGFRPETARQFDKARAYYALLSYTADALIKAAADKPGRYTPAEYAALLQVNVPDRAVTSEQKSQLARTVQIQPKIRSFIPPVLQEGLKLRA